jgi:serine/threonine protein kinase
MVFEAQSGTQIGEYKLLERLGSGGFAEVWKAQHHILNQVVAIKIPLNEATDLFRAEIRALDRLDHPHIVKVIAASVTHDPPYLVMDYIEGGTLREQLKTEKKLPIAEVQKLCRQILEGLNLAHNKGIVHGDLKPENILLGKNGAATIADFGLSQGSQEARQSVQLSGTMEQSGTVSGTLDYMPREVKDGQKPDARADIYAFGVMLFELLIGRRPDVDEKPGDILGPSCPGIIDKLFSSCYTRYENRFENAAQALKLIEVAELESASKEDSRTEKATLVVEDAMGQPWLWAFIVVGFLALMVLGRFLGPVYAAVLGVIYFGTLTVYSWTSD